MRNGAKRSRATVLAAGALLACAVLAGCSSFNPFRGSERGYVAPREIGDGDCSTEVLNRSGRPLEVYYYLGLRNPPRVTAGWDRLGLLEPGDGSVIYADCEHRRVTLHAYATSPVDPSREYTNIRREVALVKGRREVLRLRLVR